MSLRRPVLSKIKHTHCDEKVSKILSDICFNRSVEYSVIQQRSCYAKTLGLSEAIVTHPNTVNILTNIYLASLLNSCESATCDPHLMHLGNKSTMQSIIVKCIIINYMIKTHTVQTLTCSHILDADDFLACSLEAASRHIIDHGMEGFDYEKAYP